jgi:hypothetical protein
MAFPDPNVTPSYTLGSKTWDWDGQKWVLTAINVGLPDFRAVTPVTVEETPGVVQYGYDTDSMTELTA